MIIRDLDVISVPVLPAKTDAVLIVDANAILPRPISFQCFQPIRRRRRNVSKLFRAVDLHQSSKGDGANLLKRLDSPLVKDRLCILVRNERIKRISYYVFRYTQFRRNVAEVANRRVQKFRLRRGTHPDFPVGTPVYAAWK
jgi:hypothetical protein